MPSQGERPSVILRYLGLGLVIQEIFGPIGPCRGFGGCSFSRFLVGVAFLAYPSLYPREALTCGFVRFPVHQVALSCPSGGPHLTPRCPSDGPHFFPCLTLAGPIWDNTGALFISRGFAGLLPRARMRANTGIFLHFAGGGA